MNGLKDMEMRQVEKDKQINPSSLPYGKLLGVLKQDNCGIKLSPVVEYALNVFQEKSPLLLMSNFSDRLRDKFFEDLSLRSFSSLVNIAKELGWEIIGSPAKDNAATKIERPFFGCQATTQRSNKIYLSQALPLPLARATIAHEIMHSLFSTVNNKRPGNLSSDYIEEVLCDYGAAKFLVNDHVLRNELSSPSTNIADRVVYLSDYFKVPKTYIAYRIFDVLGENNVKNISSIVEWQLDNGPEIAEIVPYWSVSENSYIPSPKTKKKCTAKKDSIIYQTFFSKNETEVDFNISSDVENVSIASLKGVYKIFVCAFGRLESRTRYAISVFCLK